MGEKREDNLYEESAQYYIQRDNIAECCIWESTRTVVDFTKLCST